MSQEKAITLSEVADYLASIAWGRVKPIEIKDEPAIWFVSEREFNLLRWARRALKIMAEANEANVRYSEIKDCEELLESIVEANLSGETAVPDPEMRLDGADLTLMRKAVVFVTQFDVQKKENDAKEARSKQWKGKR